MNASVTTILDTMRDVSTMTAGQGLASIVELVHNAHTNAGNGSDEKRSEFNRWLIVFAAVVGAFFVLRGVRRITRLAFGLFWVWLFVGNHLGHLHFWW